MWMWGPAFQASAELRARETMTTLKQKNDGPVDALVSDVYSAPSCVPRRVSPAATLQVYQSLPGAPRALARDEFASLDAAASNPHHHPRI